MKDWPVFNDQAGAIAQNAGFGPRAGPKSEATIRPSEQFPYHITVFEGNAARAGRSVEARTLLNETMERLYGPSHSRTRDARSVGRGGLGHARPAIRRFRVCPVLAGNETKAVHIRETELPSIQWIRSRWVTGSLIGGIS
jgi:hypothetical protein